MTAGLKTEFEKSLTVLWPRKHTATVAYVNSFPEKFKAKCGHVLLGMFSASFLWVTRLASWVGLPKLCCSSLFIFCKNKKASTGGNADSNSNSNKDHRFHRVSTVSLFLGRALCMAHYIFSSSQPCMVMMLLRPFYRWESQGFKKLMSIKPKLQPG